MIAGGPKNSGWLLMNKGVRMYDCKAVIACLLFLLWITVSPASVSSSRYDRTVFALQSAPLEWRADFALIALSQLADAYYSEADLARSPLNGRGDTQEQVEKQTEWSWSVERYANQLYGYQMSIENGALVFFAQAPVTEVVLEIDGQQVMLSHPRPEKQPVFEQAVLTQFCQLRNCVELTGSAVSHTAKAVGSDSSRETSVNAAATTVKPSWAFTANGPVCSYDEIHLSFQPGDNPGAVRKLCVRLFEEVKGLLSELQEQQSYGVHVNWRELSLGSISEEGQQMVRLNEAGDMLSLNAPLIHNNPALLINLKPWLKAHAGGQGFSLELTAKALGWHGAALEQLQ